ncbi:hypothetical protein [Clostridium tertium]|uniref:hypothetical protein n=1 Tax=Clostridium tertium TaxID=1559 RepID=UPI002028ABFC|nr:hypothetical protein [Clostridium tertium]
MEYINDMQILKFKQDNKTHIEKRKEFIQATQTDDRLAIVLKAHLYIEVALDELLRVGTKRYKALELKYFKEKLNLCYGIGLIESDLYNVLKKFNTIRNKYGHRVNFEVDEVEFKEIYDLMNKEQKVDYEEDLKAKLIFSENSFDLRLRVLLASLYSEVILACQSVNSIIAENFYGWQIKFLNEYSDMIKEKKQSDITKI